MSGIQNLRKAKATDPSFNVDGLISKKDVSDGIPADKQKGAKMQSFEEMNLRRRGTGDKDKDGDNY